jgi:hypothetical protein
MKVGKTILQRSAEIGLRADGIESGGTEAEVIEASKHVHEKLDEVDLEKTTVVGMPLGTMLTLAGQLDRAPKMMADIKKFMSSQGKSEAEIAKAQEEVADLLRDEEFAEIYSEFDSDMQEVVQEKREIERKKRETSSGKKEVEKAKKDVLSVEKPKEPASSSTIMLALDPTLMETPSPSLEQTLSTSTLKTQDESLTRDCILKLHKWQQKVATWAGKHPDTARRVRQTLDTLIHAGGVYALAQAGMLGAELGAAFGPYGSAFGAVGMVALAYSSGEAFAAGIDAGLALAEKKAASLGRNPTEAEMLAETVKTTGEVGLTALALTGLRKGFKSMKSIKPIPLIKDALSEKAVVKGGKVCIGEIDLGPVEALNKAPYDPRAMEALLSKKGLVTSTTLPPTSAKNVKLAGQRHPETGIVFDQRGFPIFDDVMKAEVKIAGNLSEMTSKAHQKAATKQLKHEIEFGLISKDKFTMARFHF